MRKINLFLCFVFYSLLFTQNLDTYRLKYCIKKCKIYSKEIIERNLNNPSMPSYFYGDPKYSKMFSIKKENRMKIYPFNEYDSIYITNPNFIRGIEEPRNYLEVKYHNSLRLLSNDEKIKLSNILFNYHKTYDLFRIGVKNKVGCDCIQFEYPKIILLFKKNGKMEKFLAFPDNGEERYNFSNEEYQNFDWSDDKERVILEMFKKDILPNQNCKIEVYTPPPPPKNKK